jgi:hypothetical protein
MHASPSPSRPVERTLAHITSESGGLDLLIGGGGNRLTEIYRPREAAFDAL